MLLKEIVQFFDRLESAPTEFGLPKEVPEDIIELYQEVRDECLDESSLSDIILRLKAAQNKVRADPYNEKSPLYFMLLVYAYHVLSNLEGAILYAERAEGQFSIQGQKWYQAMNNWLLGLLYCANGDPDTAQIKIGKAIDIISKINADNIDDGIFEYEEAYKKIIGTINQSYSGLNNRVFMQASARVFSDIIYRLKVPDNDPMIQEWWEAICAMEPSNLSTIELQIRKLRKILEVEMFSATPFYVIFLAHCCNLGFYAEAAEYTQRDALGIMTIEFKLTDYLGGINEYNQSLAYLYLALLYYNISDIKNSLSRLNESKRLLDGFLEERQEEYQYEDINVEYIQHLQDDIEVWISKLSSTRDTQEHFLTPESRETQKPQVGVIDKFKQFIFPKTHIYPISSPRNKKPDQPSTSTSAPETTDYSPKPFDVEQVSLGSKPQRGRGQEHQRKQVLQRDNHQTMHIIIPVDVRALEYPCSDATPLELSLFEQLRQYHEHKTNLQPQSNKSAMLGKNVANNVGTIIPSLPIYGYATAGLNGEVVFQNPLGFAGVVDENLHAIFEDHEYIVCSTKNNDHQITYNKHIIGWLEIEGDSMAAAWPVPIEERDYVLFNRNHDLGSLVNKVVIASLPDDTQPPRLVVKYLVLKNGKLFFRSAPLSKNYPDKEVFRNYQIVGEVVAIAKSL